MKRLFTLLTMSLLIFSGLKATNAADLPIVPSPEGSTPTWYYIYNNRAGRYIEDLGLGISLKTLRPSETADGQLWKFVPSATEGSYYIESKSGRRFAYSAEGVVNERNDRYFYAGSADDALTFQIKEHSSEGFWQLYCNEIVRGSVEAPSYGSFLNKTNYNDEFVHYNFDGDAGNSFKFILPEDLVITFPKISDEKSTYWYYIQFTRNNNAPDGLVVEANGTDGVLKAANKEADKDSQLFSISGTDDNFILTCKDQNLKVLFNGDNTYSLSSTDHTLFEIVYSTGGNYGIRQAGKSQGFNPTGGSSMGNLIGDYSISDLGSILYFDLHSVITSIKPVKTANYLNLTTGNGVLSVDVEGTKNLQLFTVTGQLIGKQQVSGNYTKALNKGVYILTIDNQSYKVVVK